MFYALCAWGMRLPTADEWEYLARGGSDQPYWCGPTEASLEGNENLFDQRLLQEPNAHGEGEAAPWSDGFVVAAPVGSFPCNGFLLHDVLGNVCEIAVTSEAPTSGPLTAADLMLELRGSSWHMGTRDARATATSAWDAVNAQPAIGFRSVISVQQ
jgi:formylglycine-generating enzyme required for sulfatase activity